ncbi:cobaltochelatase subunit CobN [candidate division WOR-3 bacterium]|nr:cobaltochelatase subunit CobN [candidate division WOR-3 bacterium]
MRNQSEMECMKLIITLTIIFFIAQMLALPMVIAGKEPLSSERPRILIMPSYLVSSHHLRKAAEEVSSLLDIRLYDSGEGFPSAEGLDMSIYDLVFVVGNMPSRYKLNDAIEAAKKKTTVIVFEPKYTVEGNVNFTEHSWLDQYWDNANQENLRRLMMYLGVKFCGLDAEIEKPVIFPDSAIYHPDAKRLFIDVNNYFKWYSNNTTEKHHLYKPQKPTIGILFHKTSYVQKNLDVSNALIRNIEAKGCNVIALYGRRSFFPGKFFMKNGKSVVDSIISLILSVNYYDRDQAVKESEAINVPILTTFSTYGMTQEEWEEDTHSLRTEQVEADYGERDGMFELMTISSKAMLEGKSYRKPINYQIDWRVERAIAWANLHRMKNSDKKIAIAYYSQYGGKGNLGAGMVDYLDVPGSLVSLLKAMKLKGYNLGDSPIPDSKQLSTIMAEKGSNIGRWAGGELKKRVRENTVILIPAEKYLEWFNELPHKKRQEVKDEWGEPPGKIMVYKEGGKEYLAIPRIQFGNIILLPHPTWGFMQYKSKIYHEGAIPPHHQYIAFYYWLNREFKTNIFFNIFRIIAELPGKVMGLPKYDWIGTLMQNMLHIGPCPIHTGVSGSGSKTYVLPIDYMMTIVASELYEKLLDLEKKLSLYQQTKQAALKEQYKKGIIDECKKLKLDHDLKLNLNSIKFENLFKKLNNYLVEIKKEHMPCGSHTLSEVPEGKILAQMLASMLGKEFQEHVASLNPKEGLNEKLIEEVILNRKTFHEAQKSILGQVSEDITEDLKLALEYAGRIDECKIEIPRILDAFEGKYIPPGPTGDPVRNSDALPTGRNPYSYDERIMPTKEAWEIGKRMVNELIEQHLKKHGKYPKKIAFVLWHAESTRQHGIMEAKIFYLLGVKPVWNIKGRVEDVELIPAARLKRPRIDVLVTTSGSYRDAHQSRVLLIDKAVHLAASANEPQNFVRENSETIKRQLLKEGYKKSMADDLSMSRVFSPAVGAAGTNLVYACLARDTWKDDREISDLYIGRMGYMYGKNVIGRNAKDVFRHNLKGVEAGIFSRSGKTGLLDHFQPATFLGGLEIAVRNTSGKKIDMYIINTRDSKDSRVETLDHFFNRELRARSFNPKWIKGMMKHGYGGARYMQELTEDLWIWDVTSPDMVTEDMWNEVNEVYIEDKYNLNLKEYFDKNNPYALQSMISTMLGAWEKGYWHPTKEVLEKLAKIFAESIARHGVSGSYGTCAVPSLHKDVSKLLSDIKPELIKDYQEKVDRATGRLEQVKGYEMKEIEEKKEVKSSTPKVALAAIVIVLLIMLVVGRGLWKGMRG